MIIASSLPSPRCAATWRSRSYHAWLDRPQSAHAQADHHFLQAIRQVHAEHREAYGAIKTWQALNQRGIACGKHHVAKLVAVVGIGAYLGQAAHHRKSITRLPPGWMLERRFTAPLPNRVWSGDMTFIRTREGWLHLAVLLDLCSRKVVTGLGSPAGAAH